MSKINKMMLEMAHLWLKQFCFRNYLINYDVDDDESASSADAGGAVNNDRTLKSRNRARINGVKTFYLQIYPFCGLLREL